MNRKKCRRSFSWIFFGIGLFAVLERATFSEPAFAEKKSERKSLAPLIVDNRVDDDRYSGAFARLPTHFQTQTWESGSKTRRRTASFQTGTTLDPPEACVGKQDWKHMSQKRFAESASQQQRRGSKPSEIKLQSLPEAAYQGPRQENYAERLEFYRDVFQWACLKAKEPSGVRWSLTEDQRKECQSAVRASFEKGDGFNFFQSRLESTWGEREACPPEALKQEFLSLQKSTASQKAPLFKKCHQAMVDLLAEFVTTQLETLRVKGLEPPEGKWKEWERDYLGSQEFAQKRKSLYYDYQVEGDRFASLHRLLTPAEGEKGPAFLASSAARDRPGLDNALQVSLHKGDKQLFSAFRHTALAPFQEKDPLLRQAWGTQAYGQYVRSVLAAHARDHADEGGPKKCPETFQLTSVMLLTPQIGIVGAFRGRENERQQLEESRRAAHLWDGVLMPIPGCENKTTLQVQFANVPANEWASASGKKWLFDSQSQDQMNARGFVKFMKELRQELDVLDSKEGYQSNSFEIKNNHAQQAGVLKKYESKITQLESEYREKATALREDQERCAPDAKGVGWKSSNCLVFLKNRSRDLLKIEKQRDELWKKVQQEQRVVYQKNAAQTAGERARWVDSLRLAANALQENDSRSQAMIEQKRRYADLLELEGQIEKMYFEKGYQKSDQRLELQSRWVIAASMLGHSVDFYCKSGKDRTGAVNQKIEADLIYHEKYGSFPAWEDLSKNSKNLQTYQAIEQAVFHGSANRATSGANQPGAEGLQFGHYQNQQHLQIDKKLGRLPKDVVKKTKKGVPVSPLSEEE